MDRTAHRLESLEQRTHLAVSASLFPLGFDGPGFDNAQKIVPTSDGVIVAGLFSGRVDFDPSAGRTRLTARGDTDVYIASYNAAGSLNWAIQIGGDYIDKAMRDYKRRDVPTNAKRIGLFVGQVGEQPRGAGEYINDLKVDSAGNIILAGAFKRTIDIGGQSLTSDESIDDDFYDGLVAKFTIGGALTWVKTVAGPFDDVASSISLDADDNIFIGGYYARQASFGTGRRAIQLVTEGRDAGFVMRLTPAGSISWVYQFGNDAADREIRNAVNDIAVTSRGEVFFAGSFGDTVDFDNSRRVNEIKADGQSDAVLGRLNRKGGLRWVVSTGGERLDGNISVALDPSGNVYTGGYFSDEADVDPRPNVEKLIEATPERNESRAEFTDLLISKLTSEGAPVWQVQMGGSNIELLADLQVATNGTIYAAGSFFGDADFSPGPGNAILSSAKTNDGSIKDQNTNFGRNESYDWFVVSLSPRGKYVASARFGGADDDFASGLGLGDGQIFVAGRNVNAVGDRDDRNEQSLVRLLGVNLA